MGEARGRGPPQARSCRATGPSRRSVRGWRPRPTTESQCIRDVTVDDQDGRNGQAEGGTQAFGDVDEPLPLVVLILPRAAAAGGLDPPTLLSRPAVARCQSRAATTAHRSITAAPAMRRGSTTAPRAMSITAGSNGAASAARTRRRLPWAASRHSASRRPAATARMARDASEAACWDSRIRRRRSSGSPPLRSRRPPDLGGGVTSSLYGRFRMDARAGVAAG